MKNHNSPIAATIAASSAVASVRLRLARILRACRPLLVQPLPHAMVLHAIAAIRLWQARSRPLACGYCLRSLYPCMTVAFATSAACGYRLCDYYRTGHRQPLVVAFTHARSPLEAVVAYTQLPAMWPLLLHFPCYDAYMLPQARTVSRFGQTYLIPHNDHPTHIVRKQTT
ncbi:hypothetical protein BHM03_00059232 [Ensete ventricosum]|nr:hypothetical protein BHM03_00059232 [Ensete ventricosum]